MKRKFLTLMSAAAIAVSVLFITSCCDAPKEDNTNATQTEVNDDKVSDEPKVEDAESHEGHNHDAMAEATYQCPMKCEGDKTYEAEGKCPKCGMATKKLEN